MAAQLDTQLQLWRKKKHPQPWRKLRHFKCIIFMRICIWRNHFIAVVTTPCKCSSSRTLFNSARFPNLPSLWGGEMVVGQPSQGDSRRRAGRVQGAKVRDVAYEDVWTSRGVCGLPRRTALGGTRLGKSK
eukprot:s3598_g6.t1